MLLPQMLPCGHIPTVVRSVLSGRRRGSHFVPDTWVTLFAFLQAGGVDAVESEFGYGRTPSLCRPPAGRGGDDGRLPGVRRIPQDRLQDFRSLQGARAGGAERPLETAGALCQPAPGA